MKARTLYRGNKNWKRYGGRGITIAPEWHASFAAFFAEVGPKPSPRHSIERVKNDLGYVPGNVVWALPKTQARNRRNNRLLTYGGRTLPLSAWAEETGLRAGTIRQRLTYGFSIERALSKKATKVSRMLTYRGETLPMIEWAKRVGIPYPTLHRRILKMNWPIARAMREPVRQRAAASSGA